MSQSQMTAHGTLLLTKIGNVFRLPRTLQSNVGFFQRPSANANTRIGLFDNPFPRHLPCIHTVLFLTILWSTAK